MTQKEIDAAMAAARKDIDESGYGRWVSKDALYRVVYHALEAAEKARG